MWLREGRIRASGSDARTRRLAAIGVLAASLVLSGLGLPLETPAAAFGAAEEPAQPDAGSAESSGSASDEGSDEGLPALRWRAVDADGAAVEQATFSLQGPRDEGDGGAVGEDEEARWAHAPLAEVEDNVGQHGYDGLDRDPQPGVFLVEQIVDIEGGSTALEIVDGSGYRVRPSAAEGFLVGDDAEWTLLTGSGEPLEKGSPAAEAPAAVLQAIGAGKGSENAEAPDGPASGGGMLQPFALGPDGASPPYVYWETRDVAGDTLRGGASYELQGPRTSTSFLGGEISWSVSWNSRITVADCTAAPCAGPDLDPDPGEFLVKQIGGHAVSSANRYRVRQATPPAGYTFVNSGNAWVEIPGTRNTPSGWSSNTYDFGDFRVQAIPPMAPTCDAGWIYGLSEDGQLRQVAPGASSATNLGTAASGVSYFNGLGIGSGGSPVYAIERSSGSGTSQNATVWEYNTTSGTWSSTGHSTSALGGNSGTNMVGGAVNLSNGLYYFGGFTSGGDFKVYEYNPAATPRIKLKGTVVTASNSSANGDIAFNANGDLFVVHGSGTTTTIYSVTAANFAAANGGTMSSSQSASRQTMSNVNGVAFDSSGSGFLGSSGALRSYDMPGWTNSADVVTSGLNSTDLASCSSPATITIEKYVQGSRVGTNDQFRLSLTQGGTTLGTATTAGQAPGLQSQRIGPQPTTRGVTLSFTEAAAGTTSMSNYASSWSCFVDGEAMPGVSGSGTSGSVTIPASGEVIECRFTNAPLVSEVTVSKTVLDAFGENPQPGAGWTVGANATQTTGTVSQTPSATTQVTGSQGSASWSLRFNSVNARATVSVSETQQSGYEFVSGQCAIVALDGTVRTVELTGAAPQQLAGVAPGDEVVCEYVNKRLPSTLTLTKNVEARDSAGDQFTLSAWKGTAAAPSSQIGSSVTTTTSGPGADGTGIQAEQLGPETIVTGAAGGDYWIRETAAGFGDFDAYTTSYACVDTAPGSTWAGVSGTLNANGAIAEARIGVIPDPAAGKVRAIECTITNTAKGSVTWQKTDGAGATLAGSEWKIVGPDPASTELPVTDCIGTAPADCAEANDKDHRAGYFSVTGLVWGDYALIETKAPAGYYPISSPIRFTVDGDTLRVGLGPIENDRVTGPPLPLTGGWLGRDFFALLGGGVLTLGLAAVLALRLRRRRREVA